MSSYRDLEIYKVSKRLGVEVHTLTLTLPKFELYEEGSQLRRSSKAVTSLIVEGFGRRRFKADYIKYLIYSHSECDESILHLEFLYETRSLQEKETFDRLFKNYDALGRKINAYIQWVEKNWKPGPGPV